MNIGVIDVETCQPIPNILVDIWHANATGHYAGHPDPAPHLVNEQPKTEGHRKGLLSAFPRTNEEETWLRAAQPTDENGVTEFTSIFPGYYTGRATRKPQNQLPAPKKLTYPPRNADIHARIHPKWDMLPNGTFISGQMAHTGQFFVPDDINVRVDKVSALGQASLSPTDRIAFSSGHTLPTPSRTCPAEAGPETGSTRSTFSRTRRSVATSPCLTFSSSAVSWSRG